MVVLKAYMQNLLLDTRYTMNDLDEVGKIALIYSIILWRFLWPGR